jgi:hypothetical protein
MDGGDGVRHSRAERERGGASVGEEGRVSEATRGEGSRASLSPQLTCPVAVASGERRGEARSMAASTRRGGSR